MGKENLCRSSQSTNWEDFRTLGFEVSDINSFTGTSKYKETHRGGLSLLRGLMNPLSSC